jgi:FAD/FMN-containing dehydrogenase/Fe-S oxidoreductase
MPPLDQQRERIQDDIRGLIAGEVLCDDVFLQLFASDASIYQIKPQAVVRPRSAADVSACVRYAAEKRIPIHARGAGTGVAGESLGAGLILDFSAHLRRVIRVDAECVRVQPGLVYERLNETLRSSGRVFGPDPATGAVTTLGGMISIDAAGSHWPKYGSTRRHVQRLQVVLADGELLDVGREPIENGQSASTIPRKRDIVNRLVALLTQKAEVIRQHQPNTPQNHCGYELVNVLGDGYLDLARLLVGSEGTLALITEATLATEPLPRCRGVGLLLFDSVEKAARAVRDVLANGPSACDLMDRRHLSLAREAEPRFNQLIPGETEAALLVEQDGDDPLEVRGRLHHLVNELWQQRRIAFGARQAFEADETELFWRLARSSQPMLHRATGSSRPLPIVEDMAVSPDLLPDFFVQVQNVLKRNQVTASVYCHAGQGQLHLQPYLDLAGPDDVQRMRRLAEELYDEVFALGGSIGGEHGCGISRTAFVRRQAGPLFDVFREIKRIFDPDNILNPGKIVGDDPDPALRYVGPLLPVAARTPSESTGAEAVAANAASQTASVSPTATAVGSADPEPSKDLASPKLRNLIELQLNWDSSRVSDAVSACNRCGECRTQTPKLRMCPIFRCHPTEEASPRAKANLLRGVLTGTLDLSVLTSDEFKTIADLCVHCHACRLECPSGVDIPRLMRESKGAYLAANGFSPAQWAMTRLDLLGSLGGLIAPAVNWALANRQTRWLLEKTFGVAQGRKLPRVASRSFLRRAARRRLTRPSRHAGQKVLYFVDVYANYFDPQLAEALVAVLEHNGVRVYVHPDQWQAGMASIACGALDHARSIAEHNVALLAESVRQGYHIVATEPAAALCLKHEYPQLVDDDDARLVAANSSEAGGLLWQMHTRGQLQLDFKPLNLTLGYHLPCHLRALQNGPHGEDLLGLIPGLRLHRLDAGCSGMAGTYGLLHKNYRSSLRAGLHLISRLRHPDLHAGVTECSTCKIQMEQGTTKPTIHPVKLLALCYGSMPEIARLLNSPGHELIVT